MITCDEKWVYHDTPKRKYVFSKKGEQSQGGLPKKGFYVQKTMLTVFWDVQGVVHFEYLLKGHTITAASYCNVLDRVQEAVRRKRPCLLEGGCKVILQQDNARPHTAMLTLTGFRPDSFCLRDHRIRTVARWCHSLTQHWLQWDNTFVSEYTE